MSNVNQVNSNSQVQQIVASWCGSAPPPCAAQIDDAVHGQGGTLRREPSAGALKTNEIRADKVEDVRRGSRARGTYETDDKLNAAADRLLDDLLNEFRYCEVKADIITP